MPEKLPSDIVLNPQNNVNVVTRKSGKVIKLVQPKAKERGSASIPTQSKQRVTATLVEDDIALENEEKPLVQKKEALPKSEIRLRFLKD